MGHLWRAAERLRILIYVEAASAAFSFWPCAPAVRIAPNPSRLPASLLALSDFDFDPMRREAAGHQLNVMASSGLPRASINASGRATIRPLSLNISAIF